MFFASSQAEPRTSGRSQQATTTVLAHAERPSDRRPHGRFSRGRSLWLASHGDNEPPSEASTGFALGERAADRALAADSRG
jgi:hypothetical protein